MNLTIRPMTKPEQMYCYTQSTQIMGQTGCIGHLRADMDTDGKNYAGVCLEGAVIVLACIFYQTFLGTTPEVDLTASAATMVWTYLGEVIFNMLILVGTIKGSDRVVKEMMGV